MTQALDGTLDAHSRDQLTKMSARDVAAGHYEGELARYTSPTDWWQIATLPAGTPAGFVIPARNDYNPIIAYRGVLPEHRGNGYINDILAEGTRILARHQVPRSAPPRTSATPPWRTPSSVPDTSISDERSK